MSSDALTEAVSEAVIVGKPSDLEPNLWFDGDGNKSMTSFEALQNTRHSSFVTSFQWEQTSVLLKHLHYA